MRHELMEGNEAIVLGALLAGCRSYFGYPITPASEIAEALQTLAQGGRPANPEMLGYMLRGFFERYRRHVHWENQLVMPLARQRLNRDDLEQLAARLGENRRLLVRWNVHYLLLQAR